MKERLIVEQLRKFIENEDVSCPIALIAGMRRIGKTTVLKQLKEFYPESTYIDFSGRYGEAKAIFNDCFLNPRKILLIDEITLLNEYDVCCQDLYNALGGHGWKGKVVMTGSSPSHICKLATGKLGGGRSKLFYLPPLTFIEYLYFTGRISNYQSYHNVTTDDFKDYLLLKGLDEELTISFDVDYFLDYYDTVLSSNQASASNRSIAYVTEEDLKDMVNLLAYPLANHVTYEKLVRPEIGSKELRNLKPAKEIRSLSLSDTIVAKSVESQSNVSAKGKSRLIRFLVDSHIVNIQNTADSYQDLGFSTSDLYQNLKNVTCPSELVFIFNKVSIALNSPLFYTQLGKDILRLACVSLERLLAPVNNDLLGQMLEVYIRGALACYNSPLTPFKSVKLDFPDEGEVDILVDLIEQQKIILCEVTAGNNKPLDKINVTKYYQDIPCIRVCTTQSHEDFINGFHRIPYAKLCCMIDTGDIFRLQPSITIEQKEPTPSSVFNI